MKIRIAAALAAIPLAVACASAPAVHAATKVRMTIDEDPIVLRLAKSLGYLRDEGIEIVPVDLEKLMGEDYLMQQPLVDGRIDASYHWFNHTVFGARHGYPIEAVMVFNDAPGMTVMVANRVKNEVRGAQDFAGRNVAEGAGYGTKAVITGYLAQQAGVKPGAYKAVMTASEGRQEAVLAGLRSGSVDVMTFQEPLTSALKDTGLVSTLYDLNSGATTKDALGATFPAQSLLVSPAYAEAHPQTVQHLVNALVRTMRFINTHDADAIIAKLPPEYFADKDRAAAISYVRATLPTFARGNYAIAPESAELVTRVMRSSQFDASEEGRWRAGGDDSKVDPARLYDNRFVAQAMDQADPAQPPNANKSIWTQNVTSFRKEHSVSGGYKKQWDLSDLPRYEPKHHLTGKIRVWGSNYIKDGPLGEYWRTEFKKFQPDVEIEYNLPTTGIAIPALAAKTADVAIGRKPILMDLLTFEQVYHHPLTEMALVTGSYDVYGWMPAFIIVVNKENPIDRISLKQLDGVFGGQRQGGYVGSVWRTDYPCKRGADENIRTWGQLGLTGEWADKPIHPGGQTLRGNNTTQLSDKILCGSDQWNEEYRAYANYITGEGKIVPWSTQARDALEADKYGMYYVSPLSMSPKLKELAIQDHDGGPYVKRSLETIRDHSYPLYNLYYVYFNRDPGKPVDPKVEEFVRFLLSREGQQEVQHEGRYMPLTGAMVEEELKKLE